MLVYRITKSEKRSKDISGTGAFNFGGRWNNPGTYMLYTSENSSLAYLENLVHFNPYNIPPNLFISKLEINISNDLIYILPDELYPKFWLEIEHVMNKNLGDKWMSEMQYLAIKVRSAVNTAEFNYLLNPLFPGYTDFVKVLSSDKLNLDLRLIKS